MTGQNPIRLGFSREHSITVAQLQVGDVLTGSGATVLHRPTDFALPRHQAGQGKLALTIRTANGHVGEVYWNKRTRVRVRRSA